VSVEAGLGFDAALARVGEHMRGPLVEELTLVLHELRVGETRANALKKMAERVDVPEVQSFVQALLYADQLGSPLGKVLRVQAAEARQRRQVAAEERAMKAPVKMLLPILLFIFPVMFVVILGPAVYRISETF
jgi:tight adherence protein C